MNVAVGVISPSAAWVIPRAYVEALRRDFPHHTFLEAWDRETLRRVLVESDAAFAAFLAERIANEAGTTVTLQIKRAFALAFQRAPSSRELAAASALVEAHGVCAFGRALLNANELIYLE